MRGICTKLPIRLVTTYMVKFAGAMQRTPAAMAAPRQPKETVLETPSLVMIGLDRIKPATVASIPAAPMRPTKLSLPKIHLQ